MEYKIEKNKKASPNKKAGRPRKFPIPEMNPGETLVIKAEKKNVNNLRGILISAACQFKKKHGTDDMEFQSWTETDKEGNDVACLKRIS